MTKPDFSTRAARIGALSDWERAAQAGRVASVINGFLPCLEARAEGGAVSLLCRCGQRHTYEEDSPRWEWCDACKN